jgi:hypothetical protein
MITHPSSTGFKAPIRLPFFASRLSWVSPRVFRGKSSTGHGSDYDHNLGKQRTPPHYFARVIGTGGYYSAVLDSSVNSDLVGCRVY